MVTSISKNTPSLGVEEDSVLSMQDVALIQLNESIRLFVDGRYLPAITLAGAAEEVLGKLIARAGGLAAIHESVARIDELRAATGLAVMGSMKGKEIIDQWNRTRNALKHLTIDGTEPTLRVNLCDEAYWMIRRCLANAEKLQILVEAADLLEQWMFKHVF